MTPSPPDHDADVAGDDEDNRGSIAIDPAPPPDHDYTYDRHGNRVGPESRRQGEGIWSFVYDIGFVFAGGAYIVAAFHGAGKFSAMVGGGIATYGLVMLVRTVDAWRREGTMTPPDRGEDDTYDTTGSAGESESSTQREHIWALVSRLIFLFAGTSLLLAAFYGPADATGAAVGSGITVCGLMMIISTLHEWRS